MTVLLDSADSKATDKVSAAIDTVLDRTIAFGYGSTGLLIRRHLAGWPADPPRMDGAVVLVTGAASGLGLAASKGFARLGARVWALARDQRRAAGAVAETQRAVPGADARGAACDLSSLSDVRSFARRFAEDETRLDVLVNNAGVMPDQRERSADGHELMFATHVLAPFALASLLRELLERAAPSVVINVRPIIRTPEQGADTIVWPGAAPEALRSTGKFWHDRRPRPSHYPLGASGDSACDRQQLWNLCAKSLLAQATTASDPEFAA